MNCTVEILTTINGEGHQGSATFCWYDAASNTAYLITAAHVVYSVEHGPATAITIGLDIPLAGTLLGYGHITGLGDSQTLVSSENDWALVKTTPLPGITALPGYLGLWQDFSGPVGSISGWPDGAFITVEGTPLTVIPNTTTLQGILEDAGSSGGPAWGAINGVNAIGGIKSANNVTMNASIYCQVTPQIVSEVEKLIAADCGRALGIFRLYQLLGRYPELPVTDTSGWSGWTAAYASAEDALSSSLGRTASAYEVLMASLGGGVDIVAGFLNSEEFRNKYGGLDNAGFVAMLYSRVLMRAPDASSLVWIDALDNRSWSRAAMVVAFTQGTEAIAHLGYWGQLP